MKYRGPESICIGLAAWILASTSAFADSDAVEYSGIHFQPACNAAVSAIGGASADSVDLYGANECEGFVTGAYQGMLALEIQTGHTDVCAGKNVTQGQITQVFAKYLNDHPEKLDRLAFLIFYDSMRRAFPCK